MPSHYAHEQKKKKKTVDKPSSKLPQGKLPAGTTEKKMMIKAVKTKRAIAPGEKGHDYSTKDEIITNKHGTFKRSKDKHNVVTSFEKIKAGSGTANMSPGSRQTNTPGNFRADSAPQKFADNDAKVNTITKSGFSDRDFLGKKGKGGQIGTGAAVIGGEIAGMAALSAPATAAIGAGIASAVGGAVAGIGAAAGIRAAGNAAQQAIARKRVKKYGQEGSALVPEKKIAGRFSGAGGTGAGKLIKGTVRAFEGEKTFTGTASTVKGMRKDARHFRKNFRTNERITKRNEAISIKNKRKTESAAIKSTKVKKTYKTTAQKVGGAIKSVFAGNPQKRHEKKKKRALIKSIRKGY